MSRRMESSGGNSDAYRGSSSPYSSSAASNSNTSNSSRRYGLQFTASNFFHSPLSTLLEYSGILQSRPNHPDSDSLLNSSGLSAGYRDHSHTTTRPDDSGPLAASAGGNGGIGGEVSIRIIGAGEQENDRVGTSLPSPMIGQAAAAATTHNEVLIQPVPRTASAPSLTPALDVQGDSRTEPQSVNASLNAEAPDGAGVNHNRDSSYQRYDIQQAARWIEQVLPFSLLLLVVFIRQHLQGICFSSSFNS